MSQDAGALPIERRALYEAVADELRRRIYSDRLRPGAAVDERALCAELGVSRTPLREALKVLAREGLVELVPGRGARVRRLDPEELDALFPVMAVLEGLAAGEAARRCGREELERLEALHAELEAHAAAGDVDAYYAANHRFHQALQELAGNPWLLRLIGELRGLLRLARHHQLMLPGRLYASLNEHRALMGALRARDAREAERRMRDHLLAQRAALAFLHADEHPHGGADRGGGEHP